MPSAANILTVLLDTQERHRALRLLAFHEDGEITHIGSSMDSFDDDALHWHLERMVEERMEARRAPKGHVTVMVYPEYASGDRKALANGLFESHKPLICVADTDTSRTEFASRHMDAEGCASFIASVVARCEFAHVALCGHGVKGCLVMRDDDSRLSPRAIGMALERKNFAGRLLLSLNMCDAGFEDVREHNMWQHTSRTEATQWPSGLGFECTIISVAEGKVVSGNATHFAKILKLVSETVRRRDLPEDGLALQGMVDAVWRTTRDPLEPRRHWIPPPTVTRHPAISPTVEEVARKDAAHRAVMDAFEPATSPVAARATLRETIARAIERLADWVRGRRV